MDKKIKERILIIEWDDLTEEMKKRRLFIAEELIKKYDL